MTNVESLENLTDAIENAAPTENEQSVENNEDPGTEEGEDDAEVEEVADEAAEAEQDEQ